MAGALVLSVAIGLRYQVGCDWKPYLYIFRAVNTGDLQSALKITDPAYGVLNWLAGAAGAGIWAVNLACAAIFSFGLVAFCRREPNPSLAVAVAVPYLAVVVAMGYTRQSAALGLVLYAAAQLRDGRYLKIVVSFLLAAAFHKSSVVVIPFFAVTATRNKFLSVLAFGLLSFIAFQLFLSDSLEQLNEAYLQRGYASSGAGIRVAMNVVPALVLLGFSRRFRFCSRERAFWSVCALASLAAVVALWVSPSSTAVDRVSLYLIPLQIAVLARLPLAFGHADRQNMLLVVAVIAYSLAVELVWLNFGQFSRCWVPYQNFLWHLG